MVGIVVVPSRPKPVDLAHAYGVYYLIQKPFAPETVLKMVEEATQPNVIIESGQPPARNETLAGMHLRVVTNKLYHQVGQLEDLKGQLEQTVAERTAQLEHTNTQLREQIARRQTAETALLEAHKELGARAKEMVQNAAEMKLLAEMGELLHSCVSLEEARHLTEHCLQNLFPRDSGIVYLNREFGGLVEIFAKWNAGNLEPKGTFEPQDCWGLRRGRPHLVRDVNSATKCAHFQNARTGGTICVPMMGQGQPLGLLHLLWTESNAAQDSSDVESRKKLAIGLAEILALTLANVRLREKLKAIRDPLTRLYNRRYLEDSLHREISRARRVGSKIGVIMVEIDNFKLSRRAMAAGNLRLFCRELPATSCARGQRLCEKDSAASRWTAGRALIRAREPSRCRLAWRCFRTTARASKDY